MRAELRIVSGKSAGRTAQVVSGQRISIGRSTSSDLQINTEGVSRRHCEIVGTADEFRLVDLGSRNGVVVNGKRVHGELPLIDGDQLEIARNLVVFTVLPSEPEPPGQRARDSSRVSGRESSRVSGAASRPDSGIARRSPAPASETGRLAPSAESGREAARELAQPANGESGRPAPSGESGRSAGPAEPAGRSAGGRLAMPGNEGGSGPLGDAPASSGELPEVVDSMGDPLMEAIAARAIGPFRLERRLGRGGVGMVFYAIDTRSNVPVALKVLKPEKSSKAYHAERFRQECSVVSVLQHPGIVRCLDHGRAGDLYYLSMEFVEGQTLERVRRERGRATVAEALEWTHQLLSAIGYCHAMNIIHRDLKPDNVMVQPSGTTKLIDFGIGRVLATSSTGRLTLDAQAMGTRHYMPPEQIRDTAAVDQRADLYAIAVILFQLVTGELPFPKEGGLMAEVKAILELPPRKMRELAPEAPISLERFVERGLEKSPADRFQNAEQMMLALRLVGLK